MGRKPSRRIGVCFIDRRIAKAARLRTETSYKAGTVRRAGTTRAKPFQTTVQVNDELVQRSITSLSGEVCIAWPRPGVVPTSRACPKHRKGTVQSPRQRLTSPPRTSRSRSLETLGTATPLHDIVLHYRPFVLWYTAKYPAQITNAIRQACMKPKVNPSDAGVPTG